MEFFCIARKKTDKKLCAKYYWEVVTYGCCVFTLNTRQKYSFDSGNDDVRRRAKQVRFQLTSKLCLSFAVIFKSVFL